MKSLWDLLQLNENVGRTEGTPDGSVSRSVLRDITWKWGDPRWAEYYRICDWNNILIQRMCDLYAKEMVCDIYMYVCLHIYA